MKAMVEKEVRLSIKRLLFTLILSSFFFISKTGNAQTIHQNAIDDIVMIYKSQSEYYNAPDFTNSIFYKKCESKKYLSTTSFKITLEFPNGEVMVKNEEQRPGTIQIFKDKYEIYDCSYKQYNIEGSSLNIAYTIYCLSDCLTLKFKGKRYMFNVIDGGCDIHIKNLKHRFKYESGTEALIMVATKDIVLFEDDSPNKSFVILKKGSKFKWITKDTD